MKPEAIIELEGVCVRKSQFPLLRDICLTVARQEFVGIIGPNGAGKTTLLNVIAGFEKFSGKLRLFGSSATWRRARSTRLRLGYVPQLFHIDPSFPIRALEAVMIGAAGKAGLFRAPGRVERERAMELMKMMRIDHLAYRPLGHLSGGERRKISIACALLQRPEILLLDEPTANLDVAVQREVLQLIGEIHEREAVTVLFVTHDFNMVPEAMQRAVFMNAGRIVFDGAVRDAWNGVTLSRLFDYPIETFEREGRRFIAFNGRSY